MKFRIRPVYCAGEILWTAEKKGGCWPFWRRIEFPYDRTLQTKQDTQELVKTYKRYLVARREAVEVIGNE